MRITVNIDINMLEGKQIFEYLKGFPELVTFENELLNESQEKYHVNATNIPISSIDDESREENDKKKKKSYEEKEGKRLSRVGEWLRSNEKPIIVSYDMRVI